MRAIYVPSGPGGEGAAITLGRGDDVNGDPIPGEPFVLCEGEEPKDVPAEFEAAVQAHPDIELV